MSKEIPAIRIGGSSNLSVKNLPVVTPRIQQQGINDLRMETQSRYSFRSPSKPTEGVPDTLTNLRNLQNAKLLLEQRIQSSRLVSSIKKKKEFNP